MAHKNKTASFLRDYPICQTSAPDTRITIEAGFANPWNELKAASAMRLTFGVAVWMGLTFHVLATEIYVRSTHYHIGVDAEKIVARVDEG